MNEIIKVGITNSLKIDRDTDHGLFLVSGNGDDVLLPNKYVDDKTMKIGSEIKVFIYTDSEDRDIATTLEPFAKLGEFCVLECVDTAGFGAFMDWGLPKDLFVPTSKQKKPFKVGQKYILMIELDEQTNRLIGTQKFQKYLSLDTRHLKEKQKVTVLVMANTPLGFKVIIDDQNEGMLFHSEIFQTIEIGQKVEAYIKNIRKDGKIDLKLQTDGNTQKGNDANKILTILKANNNNMPYTSKSDALKIKEVFGLSKKVFKATLQLLLKEKLIILTQNGIALNEQ
jgi:predicted RNA-binding protein (virulence factor B family)